jgi:hypothetical protein
MAKTNYIILLTLFSRILCAQNSIDNILDNYKKDKDLQHATYSFCVLDAASGKMIKEYNSELALIPASTMKIVTTSAALGILGKDYTYKTNYYILIVLRCFLLVFGYAVKGNICVNFGGLFCFFCASYPHFCQ